MAYLEPASWACKLVESQSNPLLDIPGVYDVNCFLDRRCPPDTVLNIASLLSLDEENQLLGYAEDSTEGHIFLLFEGSALTSLISAELYLMLCISLAFKEPYSAYQSS